MARFLPLIKCSTIVAFLVTLSTTYYLRSEVLTLSRIRFSADNIRADDNLRQLKESYPERMEQYQVSMKNYELQRRHYDEMLKLYRTDYAAYVQRLKDQYQPPQLPVQPQKPRAPELRDQLAQINADFRGQQYHYFEATSRLNWVCCAAALALVGGLLFLCMFEAGVQRILYFATLVLSFVFMIGPSFHSIISAIVGFLKPPIY